MFDKLTERGLFIIEIVFLFINISPVGRRLTQFKHSPLGVDNINDKQWQTYT